MKILFIGDNRTSPNWGGRGGSIALYQLLSETADISGVITGNHFVLGAASYGYVNTIMSSKYNCIFEHLLFSRKRCKIFDWYVNLEEFFGAKDFIADEPEESIENLFRYRKKYSQLEEIYRLADDADILVINGEGDLVFTTPPRREALFLLAMIELGARLNKCVFFVNAVVSDCPVTGRNASTVEATRRMFRKCRGVTVRDWESFEYVNNHMPEVKCECMPDSLFSWFPVFEKFGHDLPRNGDFLIPYMERQEYLGKLDFSTPYICIGGSALAGRDPEKAAHYFSCLVRGARELGYPVYGEHTLFVLNSS